MLFEEYKSKINVALTLNDLSKILNDIESDNKINNNEYLELKKILNNKKIEITKKTEHIEDDYVDKDKANKNKKDDKGLEI
ncbi:hypothetical protein [Fusobacterium polymorphum]|jgi:hypothetical protein|uniref:hypothetical protein n=1 Tax=Fusobacterium nucleatum subsp. polymorphum TaxID=76857 RepID=UPI0032493660